LCRRSFLRTDSLSRRKVWDILLAEQGLRTLLLTIHFLDEADILSDHVIVLSKGNLKAEGFAVELKHHFGSGYRVSVSTDVKFDISSEFDGIAKHATHDQTTFQLADYAQTARFVNKLEGWDSWLRH